jgi:hypothetical protein
MREIQNMINRKKLIKQKLFDKKLEIAKSALLSNFKSLNCIDYNVDISKFNSKIHTVYNYSFPIERIVNLYSDKKFDWFKDIFFNVDLNTNLILLCCEIGLQCEVYDIHLFYQELWNYIKNDEIVIIDIKRMIIYDFSLCIEETGTEFRKLNI